MLWGALIAATVMPSSLDTPITHDGPTTSLPELMKTFGEQADIRITVQGAPARDWVYVKFRDRPLRSVLDEIARATESTWVQTAPAEVKIHAPWPPEVDVSERVAKFAAWIEANPVTPALTPKTADQLLADALELSAKPNKIYNDPGSSAALAGRAPNERLFRRVVKWIGARRLAEIPFGESVEWRVNGRGQIQAAGPQFETFARDLQADVGTYAEALARKGISEANWKPQYGTVSAIYSYVLFETVTTGSLRVVATANDNGARITISVIDANGVYNTLEGLPNISFSRTAIPETSPFDAITTEFKAPGTWKSLMMTAEDQKLLIEQGLEARLTDAALDHILSCADRETFTAHSDHLYRALAESTGHEVVAVVPDTFLMSLIFGLGRSTKLSEPLKRLHRDPRYELENGVLVVSARNLYLSRIDRINRPTAAAVYREMADKGHVTLGPLADLAAAQGSQDAFYGARGYLGLLGHETTFPFIEIDLLKIYGHMTRTQREAAAGKDGVKIPLGGSDPLTLAALEALKSPTAQVRNDGTEAWDDRMDEDQAPATSTADPRWVFANGLPPGSVLHVRVVDRDKLFTRPSFNGRPGNPNQVSEFQIVMNGRTPGQENAIYAQVPTIEMQVTVVGPGMGFVQRRGTIPLLSKQIAFGDVQSLPKDARDRIEQVRKKMTGGENP